MRTASCLINTSQPLSCDLLPNVLNSHIVHWFLGGKALISIQQGTRVYEFIRPNPQSFGMCPPINLSRSQVSRDQCWASSVTILPVLPVQLITCCDVSDYLYGFEIHCIDSSKTISSFLNYFNWFICK